MSYRFLGGLAGQRLKVKRLIPLRFDNDKNKIASLGPTPAPPHFLLAGDQT
jgi:hypothetical protein